MKIGILGAGVMGNAHITGFRSMKKQNATYTGIYDIDKSRCSEFAGKYQLKAYESLEELLSDKEITIIDLCLPSFLHEEYAVKIAQAGKHMIIEKPVAFTVEAAKNIYRAAHGNNVRVMVAQVIRFWPEYVKIKEICDSGALGRIITAYAARLGQMTTWSDWYQYPEKSGETLMNLTLHDIDFLHYLLGKSGSVYSAGNKDEQGNYSDVMNIFTFGNGTNAMVDGSMSMTPGYPFTMRLRVLGTEGTLEFSYISGENIGPESTSSLMWYKEGGKGIKVEVEDYDPYGREIQYFAECVENRTDPVIVSEQSVIDVLTSVVAAKKSLLTGEIQYL